MLPVTGKPLQARYFGPYIVQDKVSDLNYIVSTPDRRKNTELCPINMLKSYVNSDINNLVQCANIVSHVPQNCNNVCDTQNSQDFENKIPGLSRLQNSDILCNFDSRLQYLEDSKKQELKELRHEYKHLLPDVPTRTNKFFYDVDVGDAKPIKQHPYQSNPVKQQILKEEIQCLLEIDFIEPSKSELSSPCILVPKPDKNFRMCTDYRKVNNCTKTDTFPIPRIDDCKQNWTIEILLKV